MNSLQEALAQESPDEFIKLMQSYQQNGGSLDADRPPPELEELMRSLQEGPAKNKDANGVEVTPEPGFVVKTVDETGRKVFINMCGALEVAGPGGWKDGQVPEEVKAALANPDTPEAQQGEALRFPLSLGPPRPDLDNKGEPCTVFDCILNSDVVKQAQAYKPLKVFLVQLALGWAQHKGKLVLSQDYKLPRLRYKGDRVQAQTIRMDRRPLVTEMRDVPEEPQFALRASRAGQGASSSNSSSRAAEQAQASPRKRAAQSAAAQQQPPAAKARAPAMPSSSSGAAGQAFLQEVASKPVQLPRLTADVQYEGRPVHTVLVSVPLPSTAQAAAEAQGCVEVCGETIRVSLPSCEPLQVRLPFGVAADGATARLQKDRLLLRLPYQSVTDLFNLCLHSAPHQFGTLELANDAVLELEP